MQISNQDIFTLRRTAASLLAGAVLELFPETMLLGGESTSLGFYYDFIFPFSFQSDFFALIEEKMRGIQRQKSIRSFEMIPSNAAAFLESRKQQFRAQSVAQKGDSLVCLVQIGDFVDFCEGPIEEDLQQIGAFKLLEFRLINHATGKKLVRIFGAAYSTKDQLKEFVKSKVSFQKKDHIELGHNQDLFSLSEGEEGYWRWHPRGEMLRQKLLSFWRKECEKQNFQFISTPSEMPVEGHMPHQELLRSHLSYFLSFPEGHSRLAEITYVNRSLSTFPLGMLEPRSYFCDQAHIFCAEPQALQECISSLQFIHKISKIFSFKDCRWILKIGSNHRKEVVPLYKKSEQLLIQALQSCNIDYQIEKSGARSDGPMVALQIPDTLGRYWTGPYLAIDCQHAKSFSGMILIRSLFGFIERFVALLLEHTDGNLPFWLAPEQVRFLAVKNENEPIAKEYCQKLQELGFSVTLESQNGKLNERIHRALRQSIPFVIVIGEREQNSGELAVRANGVESPQWMSEKELTQLLLDNSVK